MGKLVLELQRDAMNPDIKITDLLRKALSVAMKLELSEFEKWINQELEGYEDPIHVPDYRIVVGEIRYLNQYYGSYFPLLIHKEKLAEKLNKRHLTQPIGELESMLKDDRGKNTFFHMPFSPEVEAKLMQGMSFRSRPTLHFNEGKLFGILDVVRTRILKWALQLEKDGILGENMSFTESEKQVANNITYNITTHIGEISHSQIQQATHSSSQNVLQVELDLDKVNSFVTVLRAEIDKLELNLAQKTELKERIGEIETELESEKPRNLIIKHALISVRNILEGAAGGIIGAKLLEMLAPLIEMVAG